MSEHRETITSDTGRYTFEVVDFVPLGYEIWNVRSSLIPGYLPLCRHSYFQPFPGGRDIETDTLKAIKIEGADLILDAIGYGPKTIEEMEQYVEQHRDAKPGTVPHARVKKYKKALPVMRQIKWNK